jgi:uncharacterized protein YbaR (Trm112 family)
MGGMREGNVETRTRATGAGFFHEKALMFRVKLELGVGIIKKKLMDILACPIDKYYPLELHVFEEKEEVVEGLIVCPKCLRWYPIRDEIPEMLPDELRKEKEDLPFLKKWKERVPKKIVSEGKPFNLGKS